MLLLVCATHWLTAKGRGSCCELLELERAVGWPVAEAERLVLPGEPGQSEVGGVAPELVMTQ